MLFTDTITLYTNTITTVNDTETETWTRTVVKGVQWSDSYEKQNSAGRIEVARLATVTFPEGTYEGLTLEANRELDAIVFGEVSDTVTTAAGSRLSDLLERYPKSGRIKTVNDNSNRDFLKNKKVVLA